MFKTVLMVCAQALFIQSIAGQCMGRYSMTPLVAAPSCSTAPLTLTASSSNCGYGIASIPASSGGGLEVFSASALSPEGLSVLSENAIEGNLAVAGALPFLGAVALEGALPSAGVGAVNYGCGNGEVAILAEDLAPSSAFAGPLGYGVGPRAAAETTGYGNIGYSLRSLARPFHAGCGCGSIN